MLKIKCNFHEKCCKVLGCDIPNGEIFYANMGTNDRGNCNRTQGSRSLYLKFYGGIVDLRNPSNSWSNRGSYFPERFAYPDIFDYQPVNGTLTVEE